jgi:hypothetical protein
MLVNLQEHVRSSEESGKALKGKRWNQRARAFSGSKREQA